MVMAPCLPRRGRAATSEVSASFRSADSPRQQRGVGEAGRVPRSRRAARADGERAEIARDDVAQLDAMLETRIHSVRQVTGRLAQRGIVRRGLGAQGCVAAERLGGARGCGVDVGSAARPRSVGPRARRRDARTSAAR